MPSAEDTINTTYFGGRIYTAAKSLYLDARKKNADVTLDDVNKWIASTLCERRITSFRTPGLRMDLEKSIRSTCSNTNTNNPKN